MLTKSLRYYKLASSIGLADASILALNILKSRSKSTTSTPGLIELKAKNARYPILIRPGTSDVFVLEKVLIQKEYGETSETHSSALQSYYQNAIGKGRSPVIIDCGANIGLSSIWYLENFPRAKVVAIEPEPENFDLLRRNLTHYENAIVVKAAVSSSNRKIALSNVSDEPWAWETSVSDTGEVDAITIPDALLLAKGAIPFICKIDIEGFETELFNENNQWIEKFPLVVFEQHDWLFPWKGTGHAFYKALSDFGVRDYIQHGENNFSYSRDLLRSL